MNNTRYLLTHPEDGIYLGSCMGFGFWTKMDPAGQPEACTFESEKDMWEHINSWDQSEDLDRRKCGFRAVPVQPSSDTYATIRDCVNAGLEAWDPDMEPAK